MFYLIFGNALNIPSGCLFLLSGNKPSNDILEKENAKMIPVISHAYGAAWSRKHGDRSTECLLYLCSVLGVRSQADILKTTGSEDTLLCISINPPLIFPRLQLEWNRLVFYTDAIGGDITNTNNDCKSWVVFSPCISIHPHLCKTRHYNVLLIQSLVFSLKF